MFSSVTSIRCSNNLKIEIVRALAQLHFGQRSDTRVRSQPLALRSYGTWKMQPRRNASLVLASAFHENHVCCGYFDDVSTSFVESPAADRTFIWTWPVLLTVVALGVMGNGLILFAISRVERFQR